MTEFNSFPDAPQSERGAYHHFTRSVTLLNRVLQISSDPMTQMSPRKAANEKALKEQAVSLSWLCVLLPVSLFFGQRSHAFSCSSTFVSAE